MRTLASHGDLYGVRSRWRAQKNQLAASVARRSPLERGNPTDAILPSKPATPAMGGREQWTFDPGQGRGQILVGCCLDSLGALADVPGAWHEDFLIFQYC